MASKNDYRISRGGQLKLKGNKSLFKSDKTKKKHKKFREDVSKISDPDAEKHGGWWRITSETNLKGGINVALECGSGLGSYLAAMDNGRFTVGVPHPAGEEPSPEEIMTLIKTPDDPNISLKTGYGKYVGVDAEGSLIATADAIGTRERLFVVFESEKSAVQTLSSNLFLSLRPDNDGYIYAVSKKVGEDEIINIRTNAVPEGPVDWRSEEDKKSAAHCETAYIKMYQHSKVSLKGKNVTVNLDDKSAVRRAQKDGSLHEFLLERRTKTKSDKYC